MQTILRRRLRNIHVQATTEAVRARHCGQPPIPVVSGRRLRHCGPPPKS